MDRKKVVFLVIHDLSAAFYTNWLCNVVATFSKQLWNIEQPSPVVKILFRESGKIEVQLQPNLICRWNMWASSSVNGWSLVQFSFQSYFYASYYDIILKFPASCCHFARGIAQVYMPYICFCLFVFQFCSYCFILLCVFVFLLCFVLFCFFLLNAYEDLWKTY